MGTPATTRRDASGFVSLAVALSLLLWCHAKPDGSLCIPSEREALLRFKRDLTDPSNRLSSWVEEDPHPDCCGWSGVVCHNSTGHVLQLRLACTPYPSADYCRGNDGGDTPTKVLGGNLNPSLLNLKHLTHLDLSFNDFQGVPIPTFLGSLENLRYLNLSRGRFGGVIPRQLRNLSSLQSLDLKSFGAYRLSSSSLEWAAGLTSLQFLCLSGVNLSRAHDWLQVTSRLPSLQQLILWSSQPPPYPPSSLLPPTNFSSLSVLDLSGNSLTSVPGWIFTLPALTSLSLSNNHLEGPIPVGLGNLTTLTSLDFSNNQLNSSLPKWLFDLHGLKDLNLGWNSLQGRIPEAIGNMTSLITLDLSYNQLNSSLPKWLFDLHRLEDLNLRVNSLQGRIPEAIGNLTSLTTLDLRRNRELQGGGWLFKSLGNLGRLRRVYLSGLKFGGNTFVKDVKSLSGGLIDLYLPGARLSGQFSDLVDHFAQFENLDLSNNSLQGLIPESIGRLSNLRELDLSQNQLAGPIPASIGRLSSLEWLDVSNNLLNGTLPASLGQLISLEKLYTSYNPMTGDVTEIHFANLTKLKFLYAVENRFSLKVRRNWVPPFQLFSLRLDSWQIGPQFPHWLQSQTELSLLKMSRLETKIEIPNWFWNSFPQLEYLNLSQSQFHGNLPPSSIIFPMAVVVDLSFNQFNSMLPLISTKLSLLNLANNYFFGSISPFLCHESHEQKQLEYLNLQNNHLSGKLSDCWRNWTLLSIIRVGNNKLTGNLPRSIGFLYNLQSLRFENNHLQGEIPASLRNCESLISIDLGENNFVGNIPTWIGQRFSLLKLLRLRSNRFDGKIPDQICALTSLQVLDLAHNGLSGSIPLCLNKFKAMTTVKKNATLPILVSSHGSFPENALLSWKGITFEYNKILGLMTVIDLSSNKLSGEIPEELMTLVDMRSLNLSNNLLVGEIPKAIGNMELLESIDFSHNQISGQIPLSMSTMTSLSYLDLSNNKLVGRIPLSTQLQSFNLSSYVGNKLCGPPVTNNCSTEVESEQGEEKDEMEIHMIYGSMAIGFIVGFWIIWGSLLFMKSWRLTYFKSIESLCERIHDIVALALK